MKTINFRLPTTTHGVKIFVGGYTSIEIHTFSKNTGIATFVERPVTRSLDPSLPPPACFETRSYVSQAIIRICLWLALNVHSLSSDLTAPRPSCYVLWPVGSAHYVSRYNYYHYLFSPLPLLSQLMKCLSRCQKEVMSFCLVNFEVIGVSQGEMCACGHGLWWGW